MKILFPTQIFYPSKFGGPANTLYWLGKALVNNGIDVVVVTSNMNIDSHKIIVDKWSDVEGIKVRYCNSKSKFPLKVVFHSIKELKSSDIVVFSSICYLPNVLISLFALIFHKKIIWSPRGEIFDNAIDGSIWKLLYLKYFKFVFKNKITFHVTSVEEKEQVLKMFGQGVKVIIIPNYMELPCKEKRNNDNAKYFLFLGRIAPIKAIDKIIDGLSRSEQFIKSDYTFKIVGAVEKQFQEYYQSLLQQIERLGLNEKVEFVGSINGRQKFITYANADYLFLLSDSENFGNVIIEALSQGTPILASHGTPWEILDKTNSGYWIDNSPEMISKQVNIMILESHDDYMKKRVNAYKLAQTFEINSNVNKWLNIFEDK